MSVYVSTDKWMWVDRTPFEIDPPITISFWVNMLSIVDGCGLYTMGQNSGCLCLQMAANKVRMYVREKTPIRWQYCESTNGLNTNQWYHFLQIIYDIEGIDSMRFYIDGVNQNTISPGAYGGDINYPDVTEFEIGRYMTNEADVIIEDFAYWNSDLGFSPGGDDSKIQLLAKSYKKRMPLQIEPANLMLYHPFDDKNIGVAYGANEARDLSGNDRHGSRGGGGAYRSGRYFKLSK